MMNGLDDGKGRETIELEAGALQFKVLDAVRRVWPHSGFEEGPRYTPETSAIVLTALARAAAQIVFETTIHAHNDTTAFFDQQRNAEEHRLWEQELHCDEWFGSY
jgi:hypothetical protein